METLWIFLLKSFGRKFVDLFLRNLLDFVGTLWIFLVESFYSELCGIFLVGTV